MNKIFSTLALLLSVSSLFAQTQQVDLTQTPGAFTTEGLALEAGEYQFNIINDGVDHEVGFVLVPKGKYEATDHIKAAYVQSAVPTGGNSLTDVVSLEAGDYEYFCPLNPTAKYSLTVHNEVKRVELEQTPGEFSTEELTLAAGTYQFNISNNGVDHEVGFVLVPKGKYEPADHITAAYVQSAVPTGGSSLTSVVSLEAGDYEYFCPLNPTAKYSLTVLDGVERVELEQTPGEFSTEELTLAAGTYQFNISNNGVDHEVGFVLVPKGKYEPADHITAAYVQSAVPTGGSSLTSVVSLEAGDYEYFCPLNPTAKYSLTVLDGVERVELEQIPGAFSTEKLALKAGAYQFNIVNNGVDHEVGFVLVPKGEYEPANHITAAYVQSVVPTGGSSLTSVVTLEAGEYEYFCPLNPTAKYPLVVED